MSRLRNGTNRGALFVLAAALVVAGGVLASATGPVRDRLPAGWPRLPGDRVWLDQEALGRWRDRGWWTPLVIVALSVGVLLFLWWAFAQLRAGRVRELTLGQPGVTLSGSALASAMAERARAVRGVADAEVALLGRSRRLRVRITLTLTADCLPGAVLGELVREAVAEASVAAAPRRLEAEVRLTGPSGGRGRGRVH
ncbi:Alkaline shock response membrane anchor protein AmaP OS=Streptomyces alboniger OX=132473 GN=CP975_01325 PE=4 SV=1 [Streptomyces alboniger]